jgi:hypothetical protein
MGTSETVCPQEAKGSDDDRQIAFSVITITCKTAEVSLSGSGFSSEQAPAKLARSAGVRSYAGVADEVVPVRFSSTISRIGETNGSPRGEHCVRHNQ